MTPIIPTTRLLTDHESEKVGLQGRSLILIYQGNIFHLNGGTADNIHVFTQGIGIYVLTVNESLDYLGLDSYMPPEPGAINSLFLHSYHEIRDTLGKNWEQMKPETMASRLAEYLY